MGDLRKVCVFILVLLNVLTAHAEDDEVVANRNTRDLQVPTPYIPYDDRAPAEDDDLDLSRYDDITDDVTRVGIFNEYDLFDSDRNAGPRPRARVTCEARRRCQPRLPDLQRNVTRPSNSDLDLRDQNCFCDALCVVYSDCCVDFQPSPRERLPALPKSVFSCVVNEALVDDAATSSAVLVVDDCPNTFADDHILSQCRARDASFDRFLELPVTAPRTGVLYKNVFCALCNGERDVTYWNVELQCAAPPRSATRRGGFDADAALWSTLSSPSACTMNFKHPVYRARACKRDVIARCDRSYPDKLVKRRCKNDEDTSYVYHNRRSIYKNKFCAKCNFINQSETGCYDDVTSARLAEPNLGQSTFRISVDVNEGQANVSLVTDVTAPPRVSVLRLRRCEPLHMFDPFARLCRQIECDEHQVFDASGKCVWQDFGKQARHREQCCLCPQVGHRSRKLHKRKSPRSHTHQQKQA